MQHWEIVNRGQSVVSNTAVDLWYNACAYFKWCDETPIITKRTITQGKGTGNKAEMEQPRPYTTEALCLHCNITEEYLRSARNHKDKNSEYYIVVSKILYIIRAQHIEYGITGIFNPIFTAKYIGLEKEDKDAGGVITVNVVTQGIPELSNSENEILEKLDLEKTNVENAKEQNSQRENDMFAVE